MATALWRCLLADSPLLQKLKQVKVYQNAIESKNILAIHEFSVFVWNADDQNILTVALKSLDTTDENGFQILMLSNPPSFEVDILQFNRSNSLLALNGKHGVSVVELPRRWGKEGTFEGGQERILCKTWYMASRFFTCNTRIRIMQVSWHPGSMSACHLCILSSDNYLRVYDVTDHQTPSHVYNLGEQSPNCYLTSSSTMSFSASLGDISVSFDFGPPKPNLTTNNNNSLSNGDDTVWPIFILKGNGDVFVVNTILKKIRPQARQQFLGPLKMFPPAEDNYGVDACSLLCLQSTPPILVIATSSGMVHHCVVLRTPGSSDSETESHWTRLQKDNRESLSDVSLYVYESVELSVFMVQSEGNGDDAFTCPIRLHKDPSVNFRYHCTHVAGLHAVAVSIIQQLEEFVNIENVSTLMPVLQEQESVVEHLICTRPFPSSPNATVLGLTVASTPLGTTLICLLSSWEIVCLPLISTSRILPKTLLNSETSDTSPLRSLSDSDFVHTLANVLQCPSRTPLLRTLKTDSSSEPSPQQCLELLGNVIQRMREDYLNRLEVAEAQVERRVKILTEQKKQLNEELERCLRSREELRNNAEKMAEKYEDINHTQQKFHKRLEALLDNLQRRVPVLADEEISMKRELQTISNKLKNLSNSFQQIELKFEFQQKEIEKDTTLLQREQLLSNLFENRRSHRNEGGYSFDFSQTKHMREMLSKQGNTITELVSKVTWLRKELGL